MSKFWKDPQNIIALGVTMISVCALIVSVTQTRVMIRQSEMMDVQARASVRPILYFSTDRTFDGPTGKLIGYRFVVTNTGIGPASIDDVRISYRGATVRDWGELFALASIPDTVPTYVDNARFNRRTLQAGESVTILDLGDNPELARVVYPLLQDIDLRLIYSSIYGDQFEGEKTPDGWMTREREHHLLGFGEESFRR